jgi:hypothetical protein
MPDLIETPAVASGPGAVTHLIQVHCDPSTLTLAVSPSRVSLNPGDTVVWSFLGIPTGWSPWIEFRQAGSNAFVGPLEGLTQAPGGIWGVCRLAGWEGTDPIPFEYRAMIQRGFAAGWETEGSLVWSAPVHLDVQPSVVGRKLTWEVTFDAMAEKLLVQPLRQTLGRGDTIVWSFPSDLPGGEAAWRPRIKFHSYEGSGTLLNQQLGPFGALSVLPGRLRGTGNNGVDGLYHFEVALVSVATSQIGWVSSGDPVVDNRGGVIIPDGGIPP